MLDAAGRTGGALGRESGQAPLLRSASGAPAARSAQERRDDPAPGRFAAMIAGAQGRSLALEGGTAGAPGVEHRPEESLEGLVQAARAVEAFFIKELYAAMQRSVPQGGLFTRSLARDIYEGMFADTLAQSAADAGGIGLAQLIVAQLGVYVDQDA